MGKELFTTIFTAVRAEAREKIWNLSVGEIVSIKIKTRLNDTYEIYKYNISVADYDQEKYIAEDSGLLILGKSSVSFIPYSEIVAMHADIYKSKV